MPETPSYVFVALPPLTNDGKVIFGKNSNRPDTEVQEVVYYAAKDYDSGTKVSCSFIDIEQVSHSHAVILSKPAWMWGAEMGANEHGVCMGSSVAHTKMEDKLGEEERLLGADLVRLTLERSRCAAEGVDVLGSLLNNYGQGGPYSEVPGFTDPCQTCTSFLIADSTGAWVVETAAAGQFWAAEKVSSNLHSLHGKLTVGTNFAKSSENLVSKATEAGLYQESDGPFNFSKVFSVSGTEATNPNIQETEEILKSGPIQPLNAFQHLRKKDIGIDILKDQFVTAGSQISILCPQEASNTAIGCHWFTATPNPKTSIFKPFLFSPDVTQHLETISPIYKDDDPARSKPRFQRQVDRKHKLYERHMNLKSVLESGGPMAMQLAGTLEMLEGTCLADMEDTLSQLQALDPKKLANTFSHVVRLEMNFLR